MEVEMDNSDSDYEAVEEESLNIPYLFEPLADGHVSREFTWMGEEEVEEDEATIPPHEEDGPSGDGPVSEW